MTPEIALVFGVTAVAIALFVSEKLPSDLVAVLVMVTLQLTGVLTPLEAIAGFANPATVTVTAMFVMGAGVFHSGAISFLGRWLDALARRGITLLLLLLMAGVGGLSAFLNNTAAVAVLLPVVMGVARRAKLSPSKLLMPLSYASMFGGMCTLLGTSTNILGNSIATQKGVGAFGMFEFARLGVLLAAAGAVYMVTVGVRLIPARRGDASMLESFGLGKYLTELVLEPGAASVGKTLGEAPLVTELDLEVLEIVRDGRPLRATRTSVLREGDVLRVRCDVEQISKVQQRAGVKLRSERLSDEQLATDEQLLVEAIMAPRSALAGRTLAQLDFQRTFGALVLGIRHRGELMRGHLEHLRLQPGDALLMLVPKDQLEHLKTNRDFMIASEVGMAPARRGRAAIASAVVAGVVVLAALGIVPIVTGAVTGALLMVVLRVIEPAQAYRAIDWKVVVLLAGLLALGAAMEKTGAARLIAGGLVSAVGDFGPHGILAALFLLTILLTEVMSNNATVALLMPIAIDTAHSLNVSPRPFLFAVMFAASSSFMTPVGYQTNTMIYGPGQYRFGDFLKVGAPLNLLFWLIGSALIPLLWPF